MSFFLGNKKRDLSDKSRNGEDAKKVKENAESTGSLSDEVFSDGLNSPECAKILVNCLRNIENQVKELFILNEETKNAQIKVTESLEFFSNKFDELERENKKKNEKIKELEETIDILTEKNKSLASDVDDVVAWRCCCLLLHGVQENENENTDSRSRFSRDRGENYVIFGSHIGVGDNSVSNQSKPYDKDNILLRNLRTKLCCIAPVK